MAHFQRAMMMDIDQAAQAIRDAEIEDFIEGFNQPTYRGIRVKWGSGRHLVMPRWVERAVKAGRSPLGTHSIISRSC